MTGARASGVIVDTMVVSWLFYERPNPLADQYRELVGSQPVLLAFQSVMELRFGALRAGWGELRRRRLERRIAEIAVVQPDDALITACAELRVRCQLTGHALGNKLHDGTAGSRRQRFGSTWRSSPTTACSTMSLGSISSLSPTPCRRSRSVLARSGDARADVMKKLSASA